MGPTNPFKHWRLVGWTREPEGFRAGRRGIRCGATGDGLPKGEAARHGSEQDLWHLWHHWDKWPVGGIRQYHSA